MNTTQRSLKQYLYVGLGGLSLLLGVIGIVLPVMPTTPFLLLAAACFARGSSRCYQWLITHPWFGEYIKNYRDGLGIPRKIKLKAIGLLWLSISLSVLFVVDFVWAQVAMLLTATLVSVYLWTRPTLAVETVSQD